MANAPRAQTTKAPATISFRGILRRAPWATVPSVLNVNLASLLRSALGWRDIVPGAQTERRGGAGPVRGSAWRRGRTGRFVGPNVALLLRQSQDFLRLRPEAASFLRLLPVTGQRFLVFLQ